MSTAGIATRKRTGLVQSSYSRPIRLPNDSHIAGASVILTICLLCLSSFLAGCGKTSAPGVYNFKQDARGYNRRGDVVIFDKTVSYDIRSDGSFVWMLDPGKDTEGYSGGSREVTEGKWKFSGGIVTCYNGDGSVFSNLKPEGADLINDQGLRYRRK